MCGSGDATDGGPTTNREAERGRERNRTLPLTAVMAAPKHQNKQEGERLIGRVAMIEMQPMMLVFDGKQRSESFFKKNEPKEGKGIREEGEERGLWVAGAWLRQPNDHRRWERGQWRARFWFNGR